MNIDEIAKIANSDISLSTKEYRILSVIAKDEKAIHLILQMLNSEREKQRELILDSNVELSRALVTLKDKNLKYNTKIIANPPWVVEQIIKHYIKWRDEIKCCFKMEELP